MPESVTVVLFTAVSVCVCARRDLLHSFSPQLQALCELASSHLRALRHGVLARHQSQPLQQLTENPHPTHAPKRQQTECVVLSTPIPQIQGLNQLSIILSGIQAATQDSPSAWVHQIGADHVFKLMDDHDLGKAHVMSSYIQELVDDVRFTTHSGSLTPSFTFSLPPTCSLTRPCARPQACRCCKTFDTVAHVHITVQEHCDLLKGPLGYFPCMICIFQSFTCPCQCCIGGFACHHLV